MKKLKDAHAARNFADIDTAQAELQTLWNTASEEMYKNAEQPQGTPDQPQGGGEPQAGPDNVTDVDFEEVKEDETK